MEKDFVISFFIAVLISILAKQSTTLFDVLMFLYLYVYVFFSHFQLVCASVLTFSGFFTLSVNVCIFFSFLCYN